MKVFHEDVIVNGVLKSTQPQQVFVKEFTYNIVALAAGAIDTQVFVLSEAELGDFVSAATLAALPLSVILQASCRTNGSVTVQLFNQSGGVVNVSTTIRITLRH